MPTVTVQPDGVKVDLRGGETVLAGLQRHGYAYRWGCRRGGCGVCKVDVIAGTVSYSGVVADTILGAEERRGGAALSCRAVPAGDVTVALRNDRLRRVAPWLAGTIPLSGIEYNSNRQGERIL